MQLLNLQLILQLMKYTWQGVLSFMCALAVGHVNADQAVYQCGQELTNLPKNPELCQKLQTSSPLQIEGTKVQLASKTEPISKLKDGQTDNRLSVQMNSQEVHQRQAQARTILEDERQKLGIQYAELVRSYNLGQPELLEGETRTQKTYLQRVASLKTNLLRIERDLQALHRELARYAAPLASSQVK
jgi:hypothetical protein